MKYLLTSIFITLYSFCFAQEKLGIKAEAGVSKITTNINELFSFENELIVEWAPSYNIGVVYSNQFSPRSAISVEGKFSQIQSTYKITGPVFDQNGIPQGDEEFITSLRISYFSIPVYYGFRVSKFTPSLGFRLSLLISDRIIYHEASVYGIGETHEGIGTDQIDYGPQIGLSFDLNDKLALEAYYYHGINNLVNWDTRDSDLIWYNRQITLGVKYSFGKKSDS